MIKGGNPNDVAKEWLKANPDAVTPWLAGVTTFDGGDTCGCGEGCAGKLNREVAGRRYRVLRRFVHSGRHVECRPFDSGLQRCADA